MINDINNNNIKAANIIIYDHKDVKYYSFSIIYMHVLTFYDNHIIIINTNIYI